MVGRIVRGGRSGVRWGLALGCGAVWWWAVLRLALGEGAGVLEGAVAAGGWGLGLLPVHCVPKGDAAGAVPAGRWGGAWRLDGVTGAAPRARRPRPGEESAPL
ncbi:hypothetical protein NX794_31850 [Streptomyces sp. LP11]|uniref:Integral membrane protein n=1 Tax=Streptomyces pyxinicus TaxID=2970331 RepID=A0ABT2BCX9_9ACTN|nr:hypothetical protein [Streptomyces sp. LP11]MCS0605763.1 hypothetical protein [Streptomyces sp. LP11]